MPTIQFSLPEKDSLKLQTLSANGESISLTAKRLIAKILGDVDLDIPTDTGKVLTEKITALDCRIAEMEALIGELNAKIAVLTEKPRRDRKQAGGKNA
jgi:hypothetical protein